MINNKKVLALIPARGGSKGIKDKNIIDLCGKPLISYTIEAAKTSIYIDDTIVTTDSSKIANISVNFGAEVPFIRPSYLADDNSKTINTVIHAIQKLEDMNRTYDIVILLQPTQPLRTTKDIDCALEKYINHGEESLVSVSLVKDHPVLIRSINEKGRLESMIKTNSTIRRQDLQKYYRVNGCIYINKINEINYDTSFNDNANPFIMQQSHSVDIDELVDVAIAQYYLDNKL